MQGKGHVAYKARKKGVGRGASRFAKAARVFQKPIPGSVLRGSHASLELPSGQRIRALSRVSPNLTLSRKSQSWHEQRLPFVAQSAKFLRIMVSECCTERGNPKTGSGMSSGRLWPAAELRRFS